jgi:ketosteroid isomerase-like protein
MTSEEVAELFVAAINAGDLDRLTALMTEDHTFIDADGQEYSGRERMHDGWEEYFSMVPDYHIEIQETYSRGDRVIFTGIADGTFSENGDLRSENYWSVPVALRAVTRGEQVAVWQLYVNPEPMRKILDRIGAS